MVNEQLKMVREFTETFRQPCPRDFVDARDTVAELRYQLINEEFKEWQVAEPLSQDLVDALADLQYVTTGSLIALGLRYVGTSWKPLEATMRKVPLDHFVGIALTALTKRPLCRDSLQPALSDLIDCINQAAAANNVDMLAAFTIVHKSNMSKASWTPQDVTPPHSTSHITPTGGIVVYNKAGKVLKPPGFVPPNLNPVLIAALRQFELATSASVPPASSTSKVAEVPGPAAAPIAQPAAPEVAPRSHSKKAFRVLRKGGASGS